MGLCAEKNEMRSAFTNTLKLWALLDSNQRPADYESAALTN